MGTEKLAIIDHLLKTALSPTDTIATFAQWKKHWPAVAMRWELPMDRALAAGLAADRPAWAFAAGYQAAIQACCAIQAYCPWAVEKRLGAVCVTESGGNHPAKIQTTLKPDPQQPRHWRLAGEKSFVTGAGEAELLFTAAATGREDGGRAVLRMAVVDAHHPGVVIHPLPPLAFVPELPHARVHFESVRLQAEEVLPGDAHRHFMKPFRTLEDLHVTAAILAWIFGVGRRSDWSRALVSACLSLLVTARSLACAPAQAPETHVVLGGFLDQARNLLAATAVEWDRGDPQLRQRWQRDRQLLEIAAVDRRRRFATAWRHYGG